MKLRITIGIVLSFLAGCSSVDQKPEPEKTNKITHFNVIFAPDLSNRLTIHKKPVSDNEIIDSVLANIYPRIANYKRKMNQMDKYQLDIVNQKQIVTYNINSKLLNIDLSQFKTQNDRINYIGPFDANSAFKKDKQSFSQEFDRITNSIKSNTVGSDIWTYLNEQIDAYKIDTAKHVTEFDGEIYSNEFKNVLLLFTDGYLESNNNFNEGKKSKLLTQSMVDRFRDDFNKNGKGKDLLTFFRENNYGIIPLTNPILKYVDILVLEVDDRSVNASGATKTPTDLAIMKLFWVEWLRNSGVKSCKLLPVAPNASVARDQILNFLGVQ